MKDQSIPVWIKERYPQGNKQGGSGGSVVCSIVREAIVKDSIVKEANREFPLRPFGSVFEVPDFGRIFLGELLVDRTSYQLTMVRLELGCSGQGNLSASTAKANGGTYPPGG